MNPARTIGWLLVTIGAGLGVSGCYTGGVYQVSGNETLSADLAEPATIKVARMQRSDVPPPPISSPYVLPPLTPSMSPSGPANMGSPVSSMPPLTPPGLNVPLQPPVRPPSTGAPSSFVPPPPTGGTMQASFKTNAKLVVRARVNGTPIFEDDVWQMLPGAILNKLQQMSEPQRSEYLNEEFRKKLDDLIDQEVLYQDALKKLEKNTKALEQIKQDVQRDIDKQVAKIRATGRMPESELQEMLPVLKRQMEHNTIAMEYARAVVIPKTNPVIGNVEIKDYYETHQNEFQKADVVEWQDIFIGTGPSLPTTADAKQFAEELVIQLHISEDFVRLLPYDQGDSKLRGGMGSGTHRGEIKPAELEDYLFKMREGEIGPVVELSTGVHLFRVLKREYAGPIPLDEKVQQEIRRKLRNQVIEREMQSFIRELKGRAVIEIERDGT